jgi:hypothetical protein
MVLKALSNNNPLKLITTIHDKDPHTMETLFYYGRGLHSTIDKY